MKNLTPQHLRCHVGCCPSVHELEDGDLTPEHMKCAIGATCPAIHAKAGQLVIIGKRGDGIIDDKVGPDEYAIVISPDLLSDYVAGKVAELKAALAEAREVIDLKNQKIDDLIEERNVNFSSRGGK